MYEAYEPADARYLTLHRGHFMFVRPDEQRFLDASILRDMTFTGTVAELRERIRTLCDAGYQQFAVFVPPGQEDALDDWARVIDGL
jgi:alkanesulfonate monooxygenase SsuD/methylene tetrahydromethanopterin reductase-like flavin-dependent oxidoreductase (luciferase family)